MPKIKPIPYSCARCSEKRLPHKSYCRIHWNEYMREFEARRSGKPKRKARIIAKPKNDAKPAKPKQYANEFIAWVRWGREHADDKPFSKEWQRKLHYHH